MDFVTSTAALSLLLGCVGIFSLCFQLLQRTRMQARLQGAVVVITGATSGLGRGGSRAVLSGMEGGLAGGAAQRHGPPRRGK